MTFSKALRAHRAVQALRPKLLSAVILGALSPSDAVMAAAAASPVSSASPAAPSEAEFESSYFSSGGNAKLDLSRFEKGDVVLPGTYRVDIAVNQQWIGREDVTFKAMQEQQSATPCFDRDQLNKFGIDLAKVARGDGGRSEEQVRDHAVPEGELCGDLGTYVPGATSSFDARKLNLTISVPQLYMNNAARGYVDPSQWDNGVNVGILGYNFTSSRSMGQFASTQSYLGLNAGVNLGAWHVRHQGSLTWSSGRGPKQYQNIATYVQRDIPALRSQLIIGDSFTSGQVADSFRLRGINLSTDDRMNPQSQQGYAPVVRGVAESNARVTIRQNGYIIYETTVAPGPFSIDDLYPTGYSGDLEVTVTEADGRKNTFLVPYAALPQLLRAGTTFFSGALGQLNQYDTQGSKPWVAQGTVQHGFSNSVTGFGAVTASQGYAQVKLGSALSTRVGAFSVSVARARTALPGASSLQGQSYGISYSKNLTQSGTNFSLGAYRFSSSGYLSLPDAINARSWLQTGMNADQFTRQRSRLDLSISQKIGNGQFFVSGSSMNYWGGNTARQTSYTVGYSSSWKLLNWSLSAQRSRIEAVPYNAAQAEAEQIDDMFYGRGRVVPGRTDNQVMLTLSMPLGAAPRAPRFTSYLTHNSGDNQGNNVQVGVTGQLGRNGNVTYGVSGNRSTGQESSRYYNANIGYQASYANLRGGYSSSNGNNQVSVAASGGVVVHSGGITFAQNLSDTIGIVRAPDAAGAAVSSATGVYVNKQGYAVVPYLTPYQLNTVSLDPKNMSDDVELKSTAQNVAPHAGAVVMLKYNTESGRAVIIKASQANGEPLPFAAEVFDAQGKVVGVVGQAGKIFARGIADQGTLTVKWADAPDSQCHVAYQLPPKNKYSQQATSEMLNGHCVPDTGAIQTIPLADRKDASTDKARQGKHVSVN